MLHVALDELPGRGTENLLASERAIGDHQRHHVLELVAKAVGAACLIKGRARPQATGDRLIEKPAIHEDIQRAIWRRHFESSQDVVPSRFDRTQQSIHVGCSMMLDQRPRLFFRRGLTE
jgi:hypothetical protein